MFLIYKLENGEMLYEVDEAALTGFSADQFGILEVSEGWRETHWWNWSTRTLDPLPDND